MSLVAHVVKAKTQPGSFVYKLTLLDRRRYPLHSLEHVPHAVQSFHRHPHCSHCDVIPPSVRFGNATNIMDVKSNAMVTWNCKS